MSSGEAVLSPVLRGDLRARARSRKVVAIEVFLLSVLAFLVFLGLPPELSQLERSREAGLGAALATVQLVLVTYFTSACAAQEISVEGEKSAVDLLWAPFSPGAIVVGKSLTSLVTPVYWLLLGLPIVVLAAAIRREPASSVLAVLGVTVAVAWAVAQWGLASSVLVESELSRTVLHWAILLGVFVVTLALPASLRWINPIVAVGAAAGGAAPTGAFVLYGLLGGLGCAAANSALRRWGGP